MYVPTTLPQSWVESVPSPPPVVVVVVEPPPHPQLVEKAMCLPPFPLLPGSPPSTTSCSPTVGSSSRSSCNSQVREKPGPLTAPSLVIAGTPPYYNSSHGTGNTKNNDRGRLSVAAGPPRVLVPPAPPVAVAVVADPPILVLPPKAAQHRASMSSNRCQVSVTSSNTTGGGGGVVRLNKFVRRLYDMLEAERASGIVEWRRGLLILQNTHVFAKQILPKYFNTRNFKTFRRQLNYYGFVHVRSFNNTNSHSAPGGGGGEYSASSSSTSALWVNRELAARCAAMECSDDDSFVDDARVAKNSSRSSNSSTTTSGIASVLLLKRVEPCEAGKTVEGRRVRKELARNTVADDLGVLSVDSILPWSEMAQGSFLPGYLSQLKTTTKTNSTVGKKNINHCRPFDMCYPSSTARTVLLEHHNYNTSTSSSLISGLSSGYPIEISRQSSSNSSRIGDDSGSDEEGTPPLSSQQQMTLSSSTSVANLLLLLSKVS